MHVGRHEAAARLDARHHGRPRGDGVEVLEGVRDAELPCDREQVQHAVRRAAAGGDRRGGVVERFSRDDLRRPNVVPHEPHRQHARLVGGLFLGGVEGGDPVQPGGRDAEEVECHRHRVRRELPAARPGARAGDALERMHLGAAHRARRVRADRLEDVLDRDVRTLVAPGRDRAVVERQTGQVEPGERHHGGRDRLVAADEADEAVEQVPSRHELDRVGDHLARDERRAHALGPHRDAVGDGDRVELHRRPARLADAALDVLGERTLVQVARHRLDPARRDADDRTRQVLVGEAGALQHRARRRAVGAVGEGRAVALGRVGGTVVRVLGHVGPAPVGEIVSGRTCSFGKRRRSSVGARVGLAVARPDDHRRAGAGEGGAKRARGRLRANLRRGAESSRRDRARAAGPRGPPRRGRRSCSRARRRGAPRVPRRRLRRRAGRCREARPGTRPSRPGVGDDRDRRRRRVSAIRAMRVPQVRQTPPVSAAARLSP